MLVRRNGDGAIEDDGSVEIHQDRGSRPPASMSARICDSSAGGGGGNAGGGAKGGSGGVASSTVRVMFSPMRPSWLPMATRYWPASAEARRAGGRHLSHAAHAVAAARELRRSPWVEGCKVRVKPDAWLRTASRYNDRPRMTAPAAHPEPRTHASQARVVACAPACKYRRRH